jgi:hypothetical protein
MDNVLRFHAAWIMGVIVLLFWVMVAAVTYRNRRRSSYGGRGYRRSGRSQIKTSP